MIFIFSSISRELEFQSVNHASIYKNSESYVFKHKKVSGEISNN